MKRLLLFIVLVVVCVTFAAPAFAADPITVTANTFTNNFRRNLLFELEAQSVAKITQIALVIQIDGMVSSGRQIPEFTPGTAVQAKYEWNYSRPGNYLPPGVTGKFWWEIEDEAGNKKQTEKQTFRVEDTAHNWQKLANDQLALYWYVGGDSFGKALFDRAVEAIGYLTQDTGVTVERQVQIFIYGNRTDFRNAIEEGAKEWTGGQAFTDYGIIVINVEPSNLEWGKEATVHELTHQIIHQKISGPLGDLSMPRWMDEGLAMYYQTYPGSLDAQFANPLKRAIQNDTLAPLRTLAGNFPTDSAAAVLAYGQSYSVVDFIFRHYGRAKVAQLLQAFKQGGYYDDLLRAVLGVDTDALENEWRKDVGAKPRAIATRSAATPTRFPTFSLSTDPTLPPGTKPTVTRAPVAAQVTPAPAAPTTAPRAPVTPITQLCCGASAALVLAVLGLGWVWRM